MVLFEGKTASLEFVKKKTLVGFMEIHKEKWEQIHIRTPPLIYN